MDIQVIAQQIAVLFVLMAIGFLVGKLKFLTPESNKTLTMLILCISLPCTILSSVFESEMDFTIDHARLMTTREIERHDVRLTLQQRSSRLHSDRTDDMEATL